MVKKLTFEQIYTAQSQGTNLAELLDTKILDKIAAAVVNRKDIDEKTLSEIRKINKKGRKMTKHGETDPVAVNASDANAEEYNIHLPVMADIATQKGSGVLKDMHSDPEPAKIQAWGSEDAEARAIRVVKYLKYVLYDGPHATWLESMDRTYPALMLEGTVYRKVHFLPYCHSTDSWMVNSDDVWVNDKAKSLERAPALTWRYRCPLSDVVKMIRDKEILAEPYEKIIKELDEASIPDAPMNEGELYGDERVFLIQWTWLDLDADGICEPYIVWVDVDLDKTVMIVPNIDSFGSVVYEGFVPHELKAKTDFVDYTHWRDMEGGLNGYGIYRLFMHLEDCASRIINNQMNVARLAINQGGVVLGSSRGLKGHKHFKAGQITHLPESLSDDVNKVVRPNEIKEPSPVMLELLRFVLERTDIMGNKTDLSKGNMPNREMPATTASILTEQSDIVNQAVHRRIYRSISKEITILCRQIHDSAEEINKGYRAIVGDPNADAKADFDLNTMLATVNADPILKSAAMQLYRLEALAQDLASGKINVDKYLKLKIRALGMTGETGQLLYTPEELAEIAKNTKPTPEEQLVEIEGMRAKSKDATDNRKLDIEEFKAATDSVTKDKELDQGDVQNALKLQENLADERAAERMATARSNQKAG
jgi:hypothetical protein